MNFKIHRGAHEIGGSCVEVWNKKSRIVIDIGMPLVKEGGGRFNFKDYEGLSGPELIKKKILPDISGFYDWDTDNKIIDGMLISHPHIDHYGFFRYLHKNICFYLGEAAKKLIDLTVLFTPIEGMVHNYCPIESGKSFYCGDFKITPYLMDHSAFDAYAFLIEADGKKLIYSGDFREHGRKEKAFQWFLNNAPKYVDALLLEGTMFGRHAEGFKTEKDIEDETVKISNDSKNIMLLYFSSQNIDRLISLYKASLRTKRIFVIDVYTANILDCLKDFAAIPYPADNYKNIRVFFPYWLCQRISSQGNKKLLYKFKKYKITRDEISQKRDKIMMMVRSSMLTDLKRINGLENADFIYSMWEGYLKDSSMKKLLDFTKSKNMKFHSIHTSGHAQISTLKKVVNRLKPKEIIPIHTFYPEEYKTVGDNIHQIADGEIYKL